jgi:hypothetical protein
MSVARYQLGVLFLLVASACDSPNVVVSRINQLDSGTRENAGEVCTAAQEANGEPAGEQRCFAPVCYSQTAAPTHTLSRVQALGTGAPLAYEYKGLALAWIPDRQYIVRTSGTGCYTCGPMTTGSVEYRFAWDGLGVSGSNLVTEMDFRCNLLRRPAGLPDDVGMIDLLGECLSTAGLITADRQVWAALDFETAVSDASVGQRDLLGACLAARCAALNTFTYDTDHDAVGNVCDNCTAVRNPDQANTAGTWRGDICEDSDGDGLLDAHDNCTRRGNLNQADTDDDGRGDVCDPDRDGDGRSNGPDNCPNMVNPEQLDFDQDGLGDACDPDVDGDGVANADDNCPNDTPNPGQEDSDGDGFGDLCDLPFPPDPCAAGQVHLGDERCENPSGVRLSHLFLADYAEEIEGEGFDPMDLHTNRLRLEEQTDAWFTRSVTKAGENADGDANDGADQPPVVARHRRLTIVKKMLSHYNIVAERVEQVGEVYDRSSEQLGYQEHVIGFVSGMDYENWSMGNYCYSWEHSQADVPCMREVRVPRYQRSFDAPDEPLVRQRTPEDEYWRHRRYDCMCPPVGAPVPTARRLPPLAMEAKSTSAPNKTQYSDSYERYLLDQCMDYRFHLAKMYQETFPQVGTVRDAYRKLLHVGGAPGTPHASADAPQVASRHRPVLTYYLSHASPALRRVMERCGFAGEFEGDYGLMPQHGAWDWTLVRHQQLGEPQLSAADRLARVPHLWTSPMRWQEAFPGPRFLHDAVSNCNGPVHYNVLSYVDPNTHRHEPRLFTWCFTEEDVAGENRWRLDNLVEAAIDPTVVPVDGDITTFEWGNIRVPIRENPVCPPGYIDEQGQSLFSDLVAVDGRQRLLSPQGFRDWLLALQNLHITYPTSTPVRVLVESRNDRGYPRRAAANFDMTLPGHWLMMPYEAWSSAMWQPDLQVTYLNPSTRLPEEVWADVDERRDACKD